MNRSDWQARHVGARSRDWLDRDAAAFMAQKGSSPCLATIRSGEGAWLTDGEGRRLLDLYGNSVHHVGYRHPRLVEALTAQLGEMTFSPRRFANEPAVLAAEALLEGWPGGPGKVLFTTGGSDAVELALKIARVATGRYKTISFWDSYHGNGFGALSVGGRIADRSPRLGPLLEGALHVPPFYRRDDTPDAPTDDPAFARASLDAMRFVFEREREIAAVIAEPIRSTPHLPPDWYWPEVRALCDRFDALLIFDEIPTGLGKTGRKFTSEHVGAAPDITVVGKALGGGVVPVAAVVMRADLDRSPELSLGHYTHEKNPFSARAALTVLRIIADEGLAERAAILGERARLRVDTMAERHPTVRRLRGRGLLFAIEMRPVPGRAELVQSLFWRALDRGLNLSASEDRDLTITAPLVVAERDLDDALDTIEAIVAEAERSSA